VDLLEKITFLYPVILGLIYLFNIEPFFITAPYFFLILIIIMILMIYRGKLIIKKKLNVLIVFFIVIISTINFSSVRYSLPVLFTIYIFIFQLFIYSSNKTDEKFSKKNLIFFFTTYVSFSFVFLIAFDFSFIAISNRFNGFVGSPTVYSAFIIISYILVDLKFETRIWKRIFIYTLVFIFTLLSKTRLTLAFMIVYPFIIYAVNTNKIKKQYLFLIVFGTLFFIYPAYELIASYYPEMLVSRYKGGRDSSFALRNYLSSIMRIEYFQGSVGEILFGRGNEYSRLLVKDILNKDLFPHNDFFRIIIDWGVLGSLVFFLYLYRIAKQNTESLMISILYLILFYSNMIFNLFIISILILVSNNKSHVK